MSGLQICGFLEDWMHRFRDKNKKIWKNSRKKVGKFKKISCGFSRCNNTFIQPVMASLSKLTEKGPWRLQLCITIKGFTL